MASTVAGTASGRARRTRAPTRRCPRLAVPRPRPRGPLACARDRDARTVPPEERQISLPMPVAPPVTKTTCPAKRSERNGEIGCSDHGRELAPAPAAPGRVADPPSAVSASRRGRASGRLAGRDAHLEVQVRPGGPAGGTHQPMTSMASTVSPTDTSIWLRCPYNVATGLPVVDHHAIAVAAAVAGPDDRAGRGGVHLGAEEASTSTPGGPRAVAERVVAQPERRRHRRAGNRPREPADVVCVWLVGLAFVEGRGDVVGIGPHRVGAELVLEPDSAAARSAGAATYRGLLIGLVVQRRQRVLRVGPRRAGTRTTASRRRFSARTSARLSSPPARASSRISLPIASLSAAPPARAPPPRPSPGARW